VLFLVFLVVVLLLLLLVLSVFTVASAIRAAARCAASSSPMPESTTIVASPSVSLAARPSSHRSTCECPASPARAQSAEEGGGGG